MSMFNIPSHMLLILLSLYCAALAITVVRILLNTNSSSKTLAYLLLIFVLPLLGVVFYYMVGFSFRHLRFNKRELELSNEIPKQAEKYTKNDFEIGNNDDDVIANDFKYFNELSNLIYSLQNNRVGRNSIKLLENGEVKFAEALKSLEKAKKFIHMEYYNWDPDVIGNQFKEICIQKAREGVKIRIIYDAFASRKISGEFASEMRKEGIEIHPIIKIRFAFLVNTLNHRDHRKLIIIDGTECYIGGINIADRYDNTLNNGNWWRDTSAKITGTDVYSLQTHFITNWNACAKNEIVISEEMFPNLPTFPKDETIVLSQIVGGSPLNDTSNIMMTYFKLFTLARNTLFITNPYFIPNESIMSALITSAMAGVDVRLMMPEKSDSIIVGAASRFYYKDLLKAGVKIYLYKKGFIHAKTAVADGYVSIVGTANMDIRSFNLNFEVMSVNYGKQFGSEMQRMFINDMRDCQLLDYEQWKRLPFTKRLFYATARLISQFL